jgi:molybdenum cofactor cytidylyltransferase
MGQDKLALPWGDTTILGHVIRTIMCSVKILESEEYEVIVVSRKTRIEFDLESDDKLRWVNVLNPQPLADTIYVGLSELSEDVQGICFIPGDQVGLELHILAKLTGFFLERTPDFLIPIAGEITGSPVFFHRKYLSDLRSLEGEQGGKKVLEKYTDHWTTYPVAEEFFLDVDTMEEYEAYQKKFIE